MRSTTTQIPEQLTNIPAAQYIFVALVTLILLIAVGHLYVLDGLTELYFGIPLWVWVQLGVISLMLGIAWIAIQLVAETTGRGI